MSKVIVLGAGHGGLAVASRLAVKGHDVEVIEASNSAVTIPQVLTLPAAYRDLFLKTGTALEEQIDLTEANFAFEFKLTSGQIIQIPSSGVGRVLATLEQYLSKDASNQWRDYIATIGALWQTSRTKLVEMENEEPLWKIVGLTNFLKFRDFEKLINRHLPNNDLKRLAKEYKSQAHVDTDSSLGLLCLNVYVQEAFGVYELAGGLSSLTNVLSGRCLELGVKFTFNQSAKPVATSKELVGVELSAGKLVAADFVVVNDLTSLPGLAKWTDTTTCGTNIPGLYRIEERSWLGLGPAHAVLGAEIVANSIGSAAR